MNQKFLSRVSSYALTVTLVLFSAAGQAKGLDELSPEVEKPGAAAPLPVEQKEVEPTEVGSVPVEPVPVVPSRVSQSFANRLFLAAGVGFTTLAGKEGDWNAEGESDIVIGYLTGFYLLGFRLATTYRYQPIDFTLKIDGSNYRGVLEGHHFGLMWHHRSEQVTYVWQSEIGAMLPYLQPMDGFVSDSTLEKVGVNMTVGAGLDYHLSEKVQIGGRLMVGGGLFTVAQLATSVTFMF